MTNPKIEEIKNNQFARACADDGRLPKWHYEIDYLLGEVERLNAAVKERDDFIYVRGKHVIELADKNDTLRAEVEQLKQYRDHIYDYVQGTGNTSPKFLGHHLAKALVLDHKALRAAKALHDKQYKDELEIFKHEIDLWKNKFDRHDDIMDGRGVYLKRMNKELDTLRAALKDARDALEFYSTPGVWGIAGPGERVSVDPCDWEQIEVGEMKQLDMRGGKRAREAIKKIEGVL